MDRLELVRLTRDALAHLYDDVELADNELAGVLGQPDAPLRPEVLRGALLDAIDDVGRTSGRGHDPVRARQHEQLRLRFVEGRRRDEVAEELGVSIRQATRDLDAALEAVATALWRRRNHLGEDLEHELSALAAHEEGTSDLTEIVEGAMATVANLVSASGASMATPILEVLPEVAVGRTVLRQAILNLLMYALAVAPGGRFTITGTDTATGVVLRIGVGKGTASGEGPGDEDAELMFSAARRLLASQGGSVERGPTAGGSLVKVVLPPVSLQKVLVVDDNPDIVRLFQRYLSGEPYRLIQATSGVGARHLALELRPDAILLDVMLPSQDGWEILQALRAEPETRQIPVIVCSVLPERALALSLGVEDFLAKPVTAAALRSALTRWCPARGAHLAPP